MEQFLISLHSGLRYSILILLIAVIFNGASAIIKKRVFTKFDRILALITLASAHTQAILGFVLYFISSKVVFSELTMKVKVFRFYTVEHVFLMLLAIVLITIGFSKAKRAQFDAMKHKTILLFYTIALILILSAIPWNLVA